MYPITIDKVTNGYKLEWNEDTEEGGLKRLISVIEDREGMNTDDFDKYATSNAELIALGRMLEAIAEHYGYSYDRWGKENLTITFSKVGHKVTEDTI